MYQLAYAQYKTGEYSKAIENLATTQRGKRCIRTKCDVRAWQNATCVPMIKARQKQLIIMLLNLIMILIIKEVSLFNYGKLAADMNDGYTAASALTRFLDGYPKFRIQDPKLPVY